MENQKRKNLNPDFDRKDPYIIAPQPGPQEDFLSSSADIVLLGGAAGGGKSFAAFIDPLRHVHISDFRCVIFRRHAKDLKGPGKIWDSANKVYGKLQGVEVREGDPLEVRFPKGARISFDHLSTEGDVFKHQSNEYTEIIFEELTHFTENQFFYMLSRNRSTCGVKPCIRATTNPDRDSWVRELVDWWVDENGFAIPERSGVIRYFTRVDDKFVWGDKPEDLIEHWGEIPDGNGGMMKVNTTKSFTFIPAKLTDNKILMDADPGYLANLKTQDRIQQARLVEGNWNISYSDLGSILSRDDFPRYEFSRGAHNTIIYPAFNKVYMVVDSASKTRVANDYSVIGVFGYTHDKKYYLLDWYRKKLEVPDVRQLIKDVYNSYRFLGIQGVWIEQGSSGTAILQDLKRDGIPMFELIPTKDKFLRLNEVLGKIKAGFVHVPSQAEWTNSFFIECESFRADGDHVVMSRETKPHDDQVDVLAYGLSEQATLLGAFKVYNSHNPKFPRKTQRWEKKWWSRYDHYA